EPNSTARPVELSGQVLTRSCQPVARALLDFWHADERGDYDNVGFRYRGHLFTDADGRYRLRTILPALYTGRTRHYHVKVQAPQRGGATPHVLFAGGADEPPRWTVPPRAGDANGGGRRRARRTVRFRARHALEGPSLCRWGNDGAAARATAAATAEGLSGLVGSIPS